MRSHWQLKGFVSFIELIRKVTVYLFPKDRSIINFNFKYDKVCL